MSTKIANDQSCNAFKVPSSQRMERTSLAFGFIHVVLNKYQSGMFLTLLRNSKRGSFVVCRYHRYLKSRG